MDRLGRLGEVDDLYRLRRVVAVSGEAVEGAVAVSRLPLAEVEDLITVVKGGRNSSMATENEQLSTWLPPAEAQALRALAKREQRSVSQMIRLAVLARLALESKAAA